MKNVDLEWARLHKRRRDLTKLLDQLSHEKKNEYNPKGYSVLKKKIDSIKNEMHIINIKIDKLVGLGEYSDKDVSFFDESDKLTF